MDDAPWRLDGYEIQALLGFGATGEVWRAVDRASGSVVALERLLTTDAAVSTELRRQAAVLGSIGSRHLVVVRDVVTAADERVVLVVDHAAGGRLSSLLASRDRLLPPELVTLLAPLASALADAHDRALVHADVAAGNVVFGSDGRPMLGGFGVARAMHLGRRAAATAADDVFALASLAVASSDRLAGAPVALVQAVEAALVEDASARPDARALAQALLASCPAAPIRLAAPPGVEPHDGDAPPVRPAGRRRSAAAVLAACCLAAAVATGILWGRHDGTGATVLPVRPQSLASDPAATAAQPAWREIVARWETLRVRAFTTSQPRLLDAVYAPASKAGAEDRARLDVMKDRGLRVRGFGVTILGVNVVSSAARTAAVRVTDAFAAYELVDATGNVVGRGSARPARTFVMQVVRGPRGWRVAAVFAGRVQPTSARTAASMSS